MCLLSSRGLVLEMPACSVGDLADRAAGGVLDLAVVERLERDLALHELLLEHLAHGGEAVLADGVQLDLVLLQLDRRVGALEVVAGGELAAAWSTALRISWLSTSDTTSKLGMAGLPAVASARATGVRPRDRGTDVPVPGRCPSGQMVGRGGFEPP